MKEGERNREKKATIVGGSTHDLKRGLTTGRRQHLQHLKRSDYNTYKDEPGKVTISGKQEASRNFSSKSGSNRSCSGITPPTVGGGSFVNVRYKKKVGAKRTGWNRGRKTKGSRRGTKRRRADETDMGGRREGRNDRSLSLGEGEGRDSRPNVEYAQTWRTRDTRVCNVRSSAHRERDERISEDEGDS